MIAAGTQRPTPHACPQTLQPTTAPASSDTLATPPRLHLTQAPPSPTCRPCSGMTVRQRGGPAQADRARRWSPAAGHGEDAAAAPRDAHTAASTSSLMTGRSTRGPSRTPASAAARSASFGGGAAGPQAAATARSVTPPGPTCCSSRRRGTYESHSQQGAAAAAHSAPVERLLAAGAQGALVRLARRARRRRARRRRLHTDIAALGRACASC